MDSQQIASQVNQQLDNAKHQRWAVYCFIGLFALSGCVFLYNRFKPADELASHTPVIAAEAKKAVRVAKQTIQGPKQLEVYNREDLIKKVPVPANVASDESNQFTATAELPKMPYGGQAVSFTNMSSGKSGIAIRNNERPYFEFGGKTKIGAVAGISTRGNMALGYIGQDVARIGPVSIGVAGGGGTLGSEGVLGAGIHISGEF